MKLLFFVLFLTLAALVGCDSPDAPDFFKSKGDEVTHEWRFDSLITVYNFNDAFDVSLVKDTVDYAVITCGKNLLDNMKWSFTDANRVDFGNGTDHSIVRNYDDVPKLELHYSYSDLNIYVNGSCHVHSDDSVDVKRIVFTGRIGSLNLVTNAEDFCLEVWFGTGRYNICGRSERFHCEPRYSAIVDADQLTVNKAYINNFSTGNVYVNPTDSLVAKIFWTGDIIYSGNPGIKLIENPGKGGLIKKK